MNTMLYDIYACASAGMLITILQYLLPESESRSVVSDSLPPQGHGILQARIQEWVAYPFSRGSSQLQNQTRVSCIAGRFFTS